jgi:hypothetical protein
MSGDRDGLTDDQLGLKLNAGTVLIVNEGDKFDISRKDGGPTLVNIVPANPLLGVTAITGQVDMLFPEDGP